MYKISKPTHQHSVEKPSLDVALLSVNVGFRKTKGFYEHTVDRRMNVAMIRLPFTTLSGLWMDSNLL
jgi:hypothetical protein